MEAQAVVHQAVEVSEVKGLQARETVAALCLLKTKVAAVAVQVPQPRVVMAVSASKLSSLVLPSG